MRILTLLILIAIYATADRPKSPLPVTNAVLNISATPVLNDAKHKDAIAAILTVVGLSSTGQIYYVGEIEPTSAKAEKLSSNIEQPIFSIKRQQLSGTIQQAGNCTVCIHKRFLTRAHTERANARSWRSALG